MKEDIKDQNTYTIIDEWHVLQYAVLTLDRKISERDYRAILIDGKRYPLVPVYDMPLCVAIESDGSFIGKSIQVCN